MTALVFILAFFGFNIAAWFVDEPEIKLLKSTLLIGSIVFGIGGMLSWRVIAKNLKTLVIYSIAAVTYAGLFVAFLGMVKLSPLQSTYTFASELAPQLRPQNIVAVYASPDHFSDLPFRLKRRIMTVGSDRGTLAQESMEKRHLEDSKKWF